MATPFRPPVPKPISKRQQTNTAGVTSKDRTSLGPRPDGGSGGETPTFEGWIPVGGIVMYSGAFADIPANWHLCDGTDGTPDLTDRFIYGTNTEGEVGDTGGTKKHKHNLIAADTPAGTATVVAITAGTPAGTINSVSAGTPSGTIGNTAPGASVSISDHATGAVQSGAGATVVTGATHSASASVDAHSHSFTGDALAGHSHTFTGTALATHTHLLAGKTAVGETEAGAYGDDDVLPPWLKLAFIQRVE